MNETKEEEGREEKKRIRESRQSCKNEFKNQCKKEKNSIKIQEEDWKNLRKKWEMENWKKKMKRKKKIKGSNVSFEVSLFQEEKLRKNYGLKKNQ